MKRVLAVVTLFLGACVVPFASTKTITDHPIRQDIFLPEITVKATRLEAYPSISSPCSADYANQSVETEYLNRIDCVVAKLKIK